MGWFMKTLKATVALEGASILRVDEADGTIIFVDVAEATWIGFVNVGDSFEANEDGWWLIGRGDGAVAINIGCAPVDVLMRSEPLRFVADDTPERIRIDFAAIPKSLRGKAAASGFKRLDAREAADLRGSSYVTHVESVTEFPIIP